MEKEYVVFILPAPDNQFTVFRGGLNVIKEKLKRFIVLFKRKLKNFNIEMNFKLDATQTLA